MTAEDFSDPYTYPGSTVLKNLFNERDSARLSDLEYELTLYRRIELEQSPIKGPFDFNRLKETHRRLFQDIYPWAGQPRTVEIRKGDSQFHIASYIPTASEVTFNWLQGSGLLDADVDDESFVRLSADLLEKINYIHPFREGNGRTQRAFLDQVAAISGRTLSWRNISYEDHLRASITAFDEGHGDAFRSVIRRALRPPIDGLSPLDPKPYTVAEPVVERDDDRLRQALADRRRKHPELFEGEVAEHHSDAEPEREI